MANAVQVTLYCQVTSGVPCSCLKSTQLNKNCGVWTFARAPQWPKSTIHEAFQAGYPAKIYFPASERRHCLFFIVWFSVNVKTKNYYNNFNINILCDDWFKNAVNDLIIQVFYPRLLLQCSSIWLGVGASGRMNSLSMMMMMMIKGEDELPFKKFLRRSLS